LELFLSESSAKEHQQKNHHDSNTEIQDLTPLKISWQTVISDTVHLKESVNLFLSKRQKAPCWWESDWMTWRLVPICTKSDAKLSRQSSMHWILSRQPRASNVAIAE